MVLRVMLQFDARSEPPVGVEEEPVGDVVVAGSGPTMSQAGRSLRRSWHEVPPADGSVAWPGA